MQQGVLLTEKKSPETLITDDMIMARCRSLTAALDYCIEARPFTREQVAFHLGCDVGHLNRQLNPHDRSHFNPDMIDALQKLCGNIIPLRYQALASGYGLHRLKSALEQENERLTRERDQLQRDLEVIKDFMREVRP